MSPITGFSGLPLRSFTRVGDLLECQSSSNQKDARGTAGPEPGAGD
jgi:hypothetical protein